MCTIIEAGRGISSFDFGHGDIFLTNSDKLEAGGAEVRRLLLIKIVSIETILYRTNLGVKRKMLTFYVIILNAANAFQRFALLPFKTNRKLRVQNCYGDD
jgi:hypothetical protein